MQLSKFSDYAFRALMYLGKKEESLSTVEELSRELCTSSHHMKKVVHRLAGHGYIHTLKGRHGGLRLGMDPKEINLGKILEITEENMKLLDCFSTSTCPMLAGGCVLQGIAYTALSAFMEKFSSFTLKDLL